MTISELSNRDSVSRQAISKTVKRLVEDHDLKVTRNARGHITGVAVVQFDSLRKKFTSAVKVQASRKKETKPAEPPKQDSLDEARRKSAWLDVERKEYERKETLGKLVRADQVRDALERCGREIQGIILQQLPNRIEEIATGITREGTHGGRTVLRNIGNDLCEQIAKKMTDISADAPQQDEFVA